MRPIFLLSAALLAAVPTSAQPPPPILPVHDVAIEYHTSGMIPEAAGVQANTVMVRYSHDRERLRIDGAYGQFYAIVDIPAGRMLIIMRDQGVYTEQPADPVIMAIFQSSNLTLRRIGEATVSGLACTVYDTTVSQHTGRVCLTDDGVLLSAVLAEPDRRPELEALRVTYGNQPAAWFEVPPGFRRLDMPNLPGGLNFGGGGYQGGPLGR
jgi:hypothetical protein